MNVKANSVMHLLSNKN